MNVTYLIIAIIAGLATFFFVAADRGFYRTHGRSSWTLDFAVLVCAILTTTCGVVTFL